MKVLIALIIILHSFTALAVRNPGGIDIEGRLRAKAERNRCTPGPNPVVRNLDNVVRQLAADRNLRLPKYCMDMNQRREYSRLYRFDPIFRAASREAMRKFKERHPLPNFSERIRCSRKSPMGVKTPTSMIGVRG